MVSGCLLIRALSLIINGKRFYFESGSLFFLGVLFLLLRSWVHGRLSLLQTPFPSESRLASFYWFLILWWWNLWPFQLSGIGERNRDRWVGRDEKRNAIKDRVGTYITSSAVYLAGNHRLGIFQAAYQRIEAQSTVRDRVGTYITSSPVYLACKHHLGILQTPYQRIEAHSIVRIEYESTELLHWVASEPIQQVQSVESRHIQQILTLRSNTPHRL